MDTSGHVGWQIKNTNRNNKPKPQRAKRRSPSQICASPSSRETKQKANGAGPNKNNLVPHDHTVEHGGFRTVLWEVPKDLMAAIEDVVVFLNYLQKCHRDLSQGATAQLLVMCNRTAVHNQLLQYGFQAAWFGGLRIATTSSAAGATARIAVVVQTGCGFLSGGRRGASMEDREDCFGRATVALTRAIRHTYIVSPIDMAGMIGMAQTLAIYHYGYHTLKNRLVQYHEPAREPSDAEAVLEWGLNTPFTSQDKPPLAIAMVVTLNGVRSLRRYRLVIAQKSKLRLTQEVTAALASHSRDHRLTASGFFPCSIDREYLYGYAGDGYRSPLWLCASHNGSPVLVHRLRGSKIYFHQATKDRRILLIPGIHYFDAHQLQPLLLQASALQIHLRASPLAGPEEADETVEDLSSDEERATTDGESEVEVEAEEADLPPEEPWCPPIPDALDDPTEMEIAGAADKLATMMNSSQPQANVFFQPDDLGALPHLWLQAKLTISLTSIQDKFVRLFMVSCKLGQQDCTVLHREEGGSIQLPQEVAIACPIESSKDCKGMRLTKCYRQECLWNELGAGWGIPSGQLFYGTHPWVHNGRSGTYTMMGLQPTGPRRVNLEVIVPSPTGLTPAKWK